MIFLTVGSQLHFDRLVQAVDEALSSRPGLEVFGQIGKSKYRPTNFEWLEVMEPQEFDEFFRSATHIIAHAGMGTIIQSMMNRKPILIMPRTVKLAETRNDHQFATVDRFKDRVGIVVANDESEVGEKIDEVIKLTEAPQLGEYASPQLIEYLKSQIR